MRIASEEQEKAEKERKKATEEEIQKIQGELDKAKQESKQLDIERLAKSLECLKEQPKEHERKLKWIRWRFGLLKANWGALIPSALFTASAILSTLALYFLPGAFMGSLVLWVLALLAMSAGVCIVCLTLKVIETVAVTSDEIAFERQKEVFVTALRDFEAERKPRLGFLWLEPKPPFHVKPDSTIQLNFGVYVKEGDIAENVRVSFYLPPGFSFPNRRSLVQQPDNPVVPNFVTASVDYSVPITRGKYIAAEVILKAPAVTLKLEGYYDVSCKGVPGVFEKFEIVVQ